MELSDLVLTVFYFLAFYLYALIVKKRHPNDPLYRFYDVGLLLKMTGGIAFGLVYTYYYNYGDTFGYFDVGVALSKILISEPYVGFKIMTSFSGNFDPDTYLIIKEFGRIGNGQDTLTVAKVCAITNLFCLDGFFANTLWFSFLSFNGIWRMALAFRKALPTNAYTLPIVFAVLFIPSSIFWGSSIMKDSVVIGALGYFFYSFYSFSELRFPGFKNLIIGLLAGFLMLMIKPYVIVSFVPPFLLWIFLNSRNQLKNPVVRLVIAPLFITIGFMSAFGSMFFLGELSERYKVDEILNTAKVYQDYHYSGENSDEDGRRSGYSLGEFEENSVLSVVSKFPAAVNVTLYRPYLWEIRSGAMLFAAIESSVFLFLTLFMLFQTRVLGFFQILLSDSFVIFCVSFSLLFAFAVGFSSYNFGALVRYKIPCLPFFMIALLIIRAKISEKKAKKFMRNIVNVKPNRKIVQFR